LNQDGAIESHSSTPNGEDHWTFGPSTSKLDRSRFNCLSPYQVLFSLFSCFLSLPTPTQGKKEKKKMKE